MQTLDIGSVIKSFSDFLPIFWLKVLNKVNEKLSLYLLPSELQDPSICCPKDKENT